MLVLAAPMVAMAGQAAWADGDFSMALTDSPDPVDYGAPITYTGTLTYVGGGDGVFDGTISFNTEEFMSSYSVPGFDCDPLPDDFITCTPTGGTIAFSGPGDSRNFTFVLQTTALEAGNQSISTFAELNASTDPTSGNDRKTIFTTVNDRRSVTATEISTSPNPSALNAPVTITFTVTSLDGLVPTGSILYDGNLFPLVNGVATASDSFVSHGDIIADFQPTGNFRPSRDIYRQYVGALTSTTTTLSMPGSALTGEFVTVTATVSAAGGGTPDGQVNFVRTPQTGFVNEQTVALVNGVATYTFTSETANRFVVSAEYEDPDQGSEQFASSTDSGTIVVSAGTAATTTTITSDSSTNTTAAGEPVTFTLMATSANGVPTGNLRLFRNGNQFGSRQFFGEPVEFVIGDLLPGTYSFSAEFIGRGSYEDSTATTTITHTVTGNSTVNPTTTTVTANPPGGAAVNQDAVFTAIVAAVGGGSTPEGDVTLYVGGIERDQVTLVNGSASFDAQRFGIATTQPVQVVFTPSSNHGGSVSTQFNYSWGAAQAATNASVASSANPSAEGQLVTFTATVTPQAGGGTPTGTVIFNIDSGLDSSGPITLANGQATFAISTLGQGSHDVFVQYSGDANFQPSVSPMLNQVVDASAAEADLSVTVIDQPDPVTIGQVVNYSFTVTNNGPDAAVQPHVDFAPSTQLSFSGTSSLSTGVSCTENAGDVVCGIASLAANASFTGTVSYTVNSADPQGAVSAAASVSGDANGPADPVAGNNLVILSTTVSSTPVAATQTALTVSAPASTIGQEVTFTATVTSAGGTPTGAVSFREGGNEIASILLDGNGVATLPIDTLAVGTHNIVAVFLGNTSFATSTSNAVAHEVTAIPLTPTTTTLVSSLDPSQAGDSVTFTATVTGNGGTPSGTVTFLDNGAQIAQGTLSAGVATFTTSALTVGAHPITARYAGDTTFAASTSAVVSQDVNAVPVSTATLVVSIAPATFGGPGETLTVTYTVTNTGNTTLTAVAVTDPQVPTINCPAATLAPAAVLVCTGTYVTTGADETAGSVSLTGTVTATATPALAPVSATATALSVTLQEILGDAADDFIRTRNSLLAEGIDTPSIADRGRSGSFVTTESNGLPTMNFTTSLLHPGAAAAEELAAARASGSLDAWIKGTFSLYERPAGGGTFGLLGLGVDYMFSDNLLLGGAIYVDLMRDRAAPTDINGAGISFGPYASIKITDGIVLDVSAFAGKSWNDVSTMLGGDTFTGRFDTNRFLFKARLEGEWLIDQLTIRPDATLFLSHESSGDYTVTNGIGTTALIPGTSITTARGSVGLTASYDIELEGMTMSPFAGVSVGVSNPLTAAPLAGAFATFEAGLLFDMGMFNASVAVNGQADASGFKTGGVQASVGGSF